MSKEQSGMKVWSCYVLNNSVCQKTLVAAMRNFQDPFRRQQTKLVSESSHGCRANGLAASGRTQQVDGAWSWTRRSTALPQNVRYGRFL